MSQVTLGLLDWAFEEAPSAMIKELSFIEKIYPGIEKKAKNDPEGFPNINEKVGEDPTLELMTVNFAKEQNREWPSLRLFEGETLQFGADRTNSLSLDKLIEVYHELKKLCGIDDLLFCLMQEGISQVGKQAFHSAIEEGVIKLLGEKSEYFLPILVNSDISVVKKDASHITIRYTFEQLITRKGEVQPPFEQDKFLLITQPLLKSQGHWVSPEAKMKIDVKKRVV